MDKTVKIPDKMLDIVNDKGEVVEKRNMFLHFATVVVNTAPHDADTDAYLSNEIAEKIDILREAKKIPTSIVMNATEISWLLNGVSKLRSKGEVRGRGWYFLIDPLRSAEPAKRGARDDTK